MGRGVAIGLGALLFASLGFNVFVLGHLSGRAIAGHGGHHQPPPIESENRGPRGGFEDPFRIMHEADGISPELRDEFRQAFRAHLPEMRAAHKEMRGLRRELGVLMSADEWDDVAIDAKLEEIQVLQARQQDAFTDAFKSVFEKLPAAERKRLIDSANANRKARYERAKERRKQRASEGGPPPPPEE